jgi:RNA-directed DNA polymerase
VEQIPPHEVAHGFRKKRSILSFTSPHVGQSCVIRLDLQDFFTSLTRARVRAILLTAGYPESVAEILANLLTHSTPADVLRTCPVKLNRETSDRFRQRHLPQGASTSPALANLCAFRLDCRLAGLAESLNVNYTRYADDLVFSGDFKGVRAAERFHVTVCRIALEEGFVVNTRKTRIMRRSVSQRAAGLVLNEKQNVPRKNYDNLKAILHNCVTQGVASQTREPVELFLARLEGRIAHVEMIHARRGEKLRAMFETL